MFTGRRRIAIAVSIVAGVAAAGVAAWLTETKRIPPIAPDDPRQVALGETLYATHCARCHGTNFEGQRNWQQRGANGRLPAPPHDASGHTWHHPDDVLYRITKDGVGSYAPTGYETDMPAFAAVLTDEEIAAVIAFIQSRWPPEIRAQQARITERSNEQGVSP